MLKAMCTYLSANKKLFIQVILLGLLASVFAVGLMFVAGYLISASADNAYSLLMLNLPLAFVQIFGLGKPLLRYVERLKSHNWVLHLTSKLRLQLFEGLQSKIRTNASFKTGDVLSNLASDIENVQNLYLRSAFPILVSLLTGLVLVLVAGWFSLPLLAFALLSMVLLCLVLPLLACRLNKLRICLVNTEKDALYACVTDYVLGSTDVAISGRGVQEKASLLSLFDSLHKKNALIERKDRNRLVVVQIILLAAFLCVICWIAKTFGGSQGGLANWIIAAALGFFPLIEMFAPLSTQAETAVSYDVSLQRLQKNTETAAPPVSVLENQTLVIPKEPLEVRFNKVSFAYPQAPALIKGISLEIPAGQKVAILGKSGSGKTTLAKLLEGRITPTEGFVSIGGVPTRCLQSSIWKYVGYISQDSYIFALSILDNLRIGNVEISLDQAWHALDLVGLKSHVEALPQGIYSLASEAGLNFSGGEAQRLALARVFLQDPSIVVLDEPTVGLDPATEHSIMEAIMNVFADQTLIMITHHLQGIESFDRVIFLENGKLEMDGSPEDLAKKNTRFKKLLAFDSGFPGHLSKER